MVDFDDSCDNLRASFKLTKVDDKVISHITSLVDKSAKPVTWLMRRIWIDEVLSDNGKCYMLFTAGRIFERQGELPI